MPVEHAVQAIDHQPLTEHPDGDVNKPCPHAIRQNEISRQAQQPRDLGRSLIEQGAGCLG